MHLRKDFSKRASKDHIISSIINKTFYTYNCCVTMVGKERRLNCNKYSKHDLFPSTGFLIPNLVWSLWWSKRKNCRSQILMASWRAGVWKTLLQVRDQEDDLNTLEIHYKMCYKVCRKNKALEWDKLLTSCSITHKLC